MGLPFNSRFYIILLTLPLFAFSGNAQRLRVVNEDLFKGLYESVQKKYGSDLELVNGIFYMNPYLKAMGHPFLGEDKFVSGILKYHDKVYSDIRMKYDIYGQELLINYHFDNKEINFFLINEFISAFTINGKMFQSFNFNDMDPAFFQVISGENQLKCLYYWYKDRAESFHNRTFSSYEFSEGIRKSYLLMDDKPREFKRNRSFVKCFHEDIQDLIRKFMKSNRIRVKTCDDNDMLKLINYCNTLTIK